MIRIAQVANGYIVYPDEETKNNGEETHVFQTFAELVLHLGEVFTHREHYIDVDEKTSLG